MAHHKRHQFLQVFLVGAISHKDARHYNRSLKQLVKHASVNAARPFGRNIRGASKRGVVEILRFLRGTWQYYLQLASPYNITGKMKNDLGLHGVKHLACYGDVPEIGLPPSKMLAVRAVPLSRNHMHPGV